MAFDEGANTNATLALVRLMRRVEALEKELNDLRDAQRIAALQRTVDNAKRPKEGPRGLQGDPGPKGDRGPIGPMPDHRWKGTRLSFQKPDGTWSIGIDLQGPAGSSGYSVMGGGGGGSVNTGATLSGVTQVSETNVFPTSDPQIELAVNTLGAKINEIIDALS